MAKRKTREEKILTELRKLQNLHSPKNEVISHKSHPTPDSVAVRSPTFATFHPNNLAGITNYSYVKSDLIKILILAILAIGIQIMLSLYVIRF